MAAFPAHARQAAHLAPEGLASAPRAKVPRASVQASAEDLPQVPWAQQAAARVTQRVSVARTAPFVQLRGWRPLARRPTRRPPRRTVRIACRTSHREHAARRSAGRPALRPRRWRCRRPAPGRRICRTSRRTDEPRRIAGRPVQPLHQSACHTPRRTLRRQAQRARISDTPSATPKLICSRFGNPRPRMVMRGIPISMPNLHRARRRWQIICAGSGNAAGTTRRLDCPPQHPARRSRWPANTVSKAVASIFRIRIASSTGFMRPRANRRTAHSIRHAWRCRQSRRNVLLPAHARHAGNHPTRRPPAHRRR